MLHRLMHFPAVFLTFFLFLLLLFTSGDGSFTSGALPQSAPAKHGLTGSHYAANTSLENDVHDKVFISQSVFYSQVSSDKNDFELPRPPGTSRARWPDESIPKLPWSGQRFHREAGGTINDLVAKH